MRVELHGLPVLVAPVVVVPVMALQCSSAVPTLLAQHIRHNSSWLSFPAMRHRRNAAAAMSAGMLLLLLLLRWWWLKLTDV
jgi:hypothetical protein